MYTLTQWQGLSGFFTTESTLHFVLRYGNLHVRCVVLAVGLCWSQVAVWSPVAAMVIQVLAYQDCACDTCCLWCRGG